MKKFWKELNFNLNFGRVISNRKFFYLKKEMNTNLIFAKFETNILKRLELKNGVRFGQS